MMQQKLLFQHGNNSQTLLTETLELGVLLRSISHNIVIKKL